MKISAVIIAKNEEAEIEACLERLSFCDEIVVMDSGSSDRTPEIAARRARVIRNPFGDFADQKNRAIEAAAGPWILSVDADERVSPQLAKQILDRARSENPGADAFGVRRVNYFFGKRMKHGMGGSDRPIRFFRKGKLVFEGRVHEQVTSSGPVGFLDGELTHFSTRSAKAYMQKLNLYTDLEVPSLRSRRSRVRRWEFVARPGWRFVRDYFFRLGVLDGWNGFCFSFLSAYYEFVKIAKF
ncbi:MAG: glycosyltransferase family 2 protein [Candidatus Omnitrophica bacterium]|nr:glycosyltransferase family 2 protein [Candidatus Omnitrophota bacterium]